MPYLTRRTRPTVQPKGAYRLAPNVLAAFVGGGVDPHSIELPRQGSLINLREGTAFYNAASASTATFGKAYAPLHTRALTMFVMGWWTWAGTASFRTGVSGGLALSKVANAGRFLVAPGGYTYNPSTLNSYTFSANPTFRKVVGQCDPNAAEVRGWTDNGVSDIRAQSGSYSPPSDDTATLSVASSSLDRIQVAVLFAGLVSPWELFANPWGWVRPVQRARTYFFPSAGGSSDTTVTPATGTTTFVGYAPTLSSPRSITPAAAALSLTGLAASLATALSAVPSVGTLSVQGYAPAVLQNLSAIPGAGTLSLLGFVPGLVYGSLSSPQLGQIQLGGYAPTVSRADGAEAQTGSLTLLGYQPGVSNQLFVVPGVGSIVLQGAAAAVPTAGISVSDVGTLTILGYQPGLYQQLVTVPGFGQISLTSYQPSVSQQSAGSPLAGAITFDGKQAIITRQDFVVPGVGAIDMQGQQALVEGGEYRLPGVGVVTFLGYQPSVSRNDSIRPLAGGISLQGAIPTIVYDSGSAVATPAAGQLGLMGYAANVVNAVFIDGASKIWHAKPMLRTWTAAPQSRTWH